MILAVDPGKDKVGIVLYCSNTGVVEQEIIAAREFSSYCRELLRKYKIGTVLLGAGTGHEPYAAFFDREGIEFQAVDEAHSTREARELYFSENPPRGFLRLIPRGLISPPRPLDDYAARIILKRFLKKHG